MLPLSPVIVVLVPDPVIAPGLIVQVPVAGKLVRTTLPDVASQVAGCVRVPIPGAAGGAFTVSIYVPVASAHGAPAGLSVIMVMVTVLPASAGAGVYVKSNAAEVVVTGRTVPAPFVIISTFVALTNVLALTVTASVPHVLPLRLPSTSPGASGQPQETVNPGPVVMHPVAFRTEME